MAAAVIGTRPSLVNKIEDEIMKAKEHLQGVDDNIRRLSGRDFGDDRPGYRPRLSEGYMRNGRDGPPPAKRQSLGGGVFARLGGIVDHNGTEQNNAGGRNRGGREGYAMDLDKRKRMDGRDEGSLRDNFRSPPRREPGGAMFRRDGGEAIRGRVAARRQSREFAQQGDAQLDDFQPAHKPAVASSVARAAVEKSAAGTMDRESRDRNRRMFGALMGTLQSFKRDEAKQRDKEVQRQAVEKKLEQKGIAEQEEMKQERRRLWEEKKQQQVHLRKLAEQVQRVKEHEEWAEYQTQLTKFIKTKTSPEIFWMPCTPSSSSDKLLKASAIVINKDVQDRKRGLEEELHELLSKGNSLPQDQRKEPRDNLDYAGDEGELDYDGAGRELVWPSGRGKVTSVEQQEGNNISVDTRQRTGAADGSAATKVRSIRGRDGAIHMVSSKIGKEKMSARLAGGGESEEREARGKDVLLAASGASRMVVQVAGNGARGADGRRVVEVISDGGRTGGGKRKKSSGGDVSKGDRLKMMAANMRDITIKVERKLDGTDEKENRKIVVERTDKVKDKKKTKTNKTKDLDEENEIEDEVTRMRKRIVEKARKMVENEEKEKNKKVSINGDLNKKDLNKEGDGKKTGLCKTYKENGKVKAAEKDLNETEVAEKVSDNKTKDKLEALKDITEGVPLDEDANELNDAKVEETTTTKGEEKSATGKVQEENLSSTAPQVLEEESSNHNVESSDVLSVQVKSHQESVTVTTSKEKRCAVAASSQAEPAVDGLQLTVDPMEKAMMEAEVEGHDGLSSEMKKSSKSKSAPSSENKGNKDGHNKTDVTKSSRREGGRSSSSSNKSDAKTRVDSKTKNNGETTEADNKRTKNSSSKSDKTTSIVKPITSDTKSDSTSIKAAATVNGKTNSKKSGVETKAANVAVTSEKVDNAKSKSDSAKDKERSRHPSSSASKTDSKTDIKTKKDVKNSSGSSVSEKQDAKKRNDKDSQSELSRSAPNVEEIQSIQITVHNNIAKVAPEPTIIDSSSKPEKLQKKDTTRTTESNSEPKKHDRTRTEEQKTTEHRKDSREKKSADVGKKSDEKLHESEQKKSSTSTSKFSVDSNAIKSVSSHRKDAEKVSSTRKEAEKSQKVQLDKKKDDRKVLAEKIPEKRKDHKVEKQTKTVPEIHAPASARETSKTDKKLDISHQNIDTGKASSSNKRSLPVNKDVNQVTANKKARLDVSKQRSSPDKRRRHIAEKQRHQRRRSRSDDDYESSSDDGNDRSRKNKSDSSADSSSSSDSERSSSDDDSSSDDSSGSDSSSGGDSRSDSDRGGSRSKSKSFSPDKKKRRRGRGGDRRTHIRSRTYSDSSSSDSDDAEEEEANNRMRNPQKKSKRDIGTSRSSSKGKEMIGKHGRKIEDERESGRRKEKSSRDRHHKSSRDSRGDRDRKSSRK
uniref:Dentin sialophosphoprotein-like n=1 Tax=Hirondellea gigas TaxID=1518452 RepID=A0A2P2I0R4_9CRUS